MDTPDLRPTKKLLDFYQRAIASYETEMREMDDKLSVVEVSGKDVHRVQWSSQVKRVEITELQDALGEYNSRLCSERQSLLDLLVENDTLRKQEMSDRIRIQDLLAITQPIAQEITFHRDTPPNKLTRYPILPNCTASVREPPQQVQREPAEHSANATSSPHKPVVNGYEYSDPHASEAATGTCDLAHKRVLRTVYLPNEKSDSLMFLIESMEKQLKEQKLLTQNQLKTIENDYKEREISAKSTLNNLIDVSKEMQHRILETKEKIKVATKEYLLLQHDIQKTQKDHIAKNQQLRSDNTGKAAKLSKLRSETDLEIAAAKAIIDKTEDVQLARYRAQESRAVRDYNVLKQQYDTIMSKAGIQIDELDGQLRATSQAYRTLEATRESDFTFFTTELASLRSSVREMETSFLGKQIPSKRQDVHPANQRYPLSTPKRALAQSQLEVLRGKLSSLESSILQHT